MRKRTKSAYRHFLEWSAAMLVACAGFALVYLYVGEPYRVRVPYLVNGYTDGSVLWVDKWGAGARKPLQVFSVPFFESPAPIVATAGLGYSRSTPFAAYRNDLVVFNHTHPSDTKPARRLKALNRIAALPGDTLRVHQGRLYINGVLSTPNESVYLSFEARLADSLDLDALSGKYGMMDSKYIRSNVIHFEAHPDRALAFAGDSMVLGFNRLVEHEPNARIFPSGYDNQNGDQYGPVVIPYRGMCAHPDSLNAYHRQVWELFETAPWACQLLFEDGTPAFAHDYYFVLSDYRSRGNDSRYYGPIPEYLIIGKVAGVIYE